MQKIQAASLQAKYEASRMEIERIDKERVAVVERERFLQMSVIDLRREYENAVKQRESVQMAVHRLSLALSI